MKPCWRAAVVAVTTLLTGCDRDAGASAQQTEQQQTPVAVARIDDPTDEQSLHLRAADVIRAHRVLTGSGADLYPGTFRTAKGLAPLILNCARQSGWTKFVRTTEVPAQNVVVETGLGTFVMGGTESTPFALHRFAARVTDGACAFLNRRGQGADFEWTGDKAAGAVLLAFDALDFPVVAGAGNKPPAYDPTSRALGVAATYGSPSLAHHVPRAVEESAVRELAAQPAPSAAAHEFGTFEYSADGLRLGLELRPQGVGLFIVNGSSSKIEIDPRDVVITTTAGRFSPFTLHPVKMGGYGFPAQASSIGPGERTGFMLSGFCRSDGCLHNALGPDAATLPDGQVLLVTVAGHRLKFTGP
jgi:hypothetical protein